MSTDQHQAASRVLSVLIVTGLLAAALAVLVPLTYGTSAAFAPTGASHSVRLAPALGPGCGQTPVVLNSSASYAVLANSTVTNTGPTLLTGDLGLSPGTSVTGFPPGNVTGTQNINNPAAAGAQGNLTLAYNNATNRTNCPISIAGNLGGQTLTPGLYKSTSSLAVSSGDLTLSGGGDAGAVFVFQIASSLTTTAGRFVNLTNGTQPGNVFWAVGSAATLGTNSTFVGTIMAYASVSLASGATLDGRALARTGAVTLASNSVVVPAPSSALYPVTFNETGLVAGTNWTATLGGAQVTSNVTPIVFHVANGTYPFTAGTDAAYAAAPSSGNLTVNGLPANQSIQFTAGGGAGTYAVTFTESGLLPGANWSMWLNGVHKAGSAGSIAFTVTNGTYSFTAGRVASHGSSPPSGTVRVNGSAVDLPIVYTARGAGAYPVTFTSSGLTGGDTWGVTLNGVQKSTSAGTIGFNATNGSNPFSVAALAGFTISPMSGSVTVAGAAVNQVITYTAIPPPTYTVTFTESGLIAGTNWSVTLNAVTVSSLTTTVVFTEPNGSYDYTVAAVAGHTVSPSTGTVPVTGGPANVAITFTTPPPNVYSVTFTESNLPTGTNWTVTLDGVAKASITSTITFTKINGTYTFTVGALSGYNATPSSGTVTVAGHTASQGIAFAATQSSSSATTLTSEWWFWAAVAILVVAIIVGVVLALMRRPKAES